MELGVTSSDEISKRVLDKRMPNGKKESVKMSEIIRS